MQKIKGYNNAKAITGGGDRLPAGGYVCRILKVEDFPGKEYLKISYDIVDGDYAKYYEELYNRFNKEWWGGTFIRSYKESALGFFKAFIEAVDLSNDTHFTDAVEDGFDEQKLVKKKIGLVIGYREYNGKERAYVARTIPVEDIEAGNYTVPELKREEQTAFADLDTADSDLPF